MKNAAALMLESALRAPEAIAIREGDGESSYRRLANRARALSSLVAERGLEAGDRILLLGVVGQEWIAAYYGLLGRGMIVVTANVLSTVKELEYLLDDAECTLAIADESSSVGLAKAAKGRCPVLVLGPEEDLGGADGAGAQGPLRGGGDDTAVLLYTSGTTGRPKGAELTHANLISAARLGADAFRLTADDRLLESLPLSHVFGQSVLLNTAMLRGASLTLQPRFDPDQALALIRRDRITVFAGVPTMYNALLHCRSRDEVDVSSTLRLAISGGAPMPLEVLRQFELRFGTPIVEGWGMTETAGAGVFNSLNRERKVGKVGIPMAGIEVRIVDERGRDLPAGETGELLVAGPVVTKGYWRRPEETAAAFDEGWFRTGDLAVLDEDGDLAIVDRKKDMIIRGGYNVYPREVEEVLCEHPAVVEAVVAGVEHPHYGQEVAAAIVLAEGAEVDAEMVRTWAKERVSAYKYPRIVRVDAELPKSVNGKLLRRAVKFEAPATAGKSVEG